MSFSVAIDGPSGAGKSTLAKLLAKHYQFCYLDTGAMYRAITLYLLRNEIELKDEQKIKEALCEISLTIRMIDAVQHIYLNGEDVSQEIRQEHVGNATAGVAACPAVRTFLVKQQQDFAKDHDIIMDGRDIGTVVLPHADIKFFLTADPEVRAKRRYEELCLKGENANYETVLADVQARDAQDKNRTVSPLQKAQDAIEVDTSKMTQEKVFAFLCEQINQKRGHS